jgi:hypothetical protein
MVGLQLRGQYRNVTEGVRSTMSVDEQQAELLERLHAARGAPLSFQQLRDLGIENPAVLCYELELVGMPIARVHHREAPTGSVAPGVRIAEPAATAALASSSAPRQHVGALLMGRLSHAHASGRGLVDEAHRFVRARAAAATLPAWRASLLAPIALVAVLAAVLALALADRPERPRTSAATGGVAHRVQGASGRDSAGRGPHASGASRAARAAGHRSADTASAGDASATGDVPSTGVERTHAPESSTAPPVEQTRAPAAPASAAQLDLRGHALLEEGRYSAAIDELRATLAASGQSSANCTVPTTETCLTYAYALYDLGRALRLDGDPRAAAAVLRKRLQIDNQRATVRRELNLATVAAPGSY